MPKLSQALRRLAGTQTAAALAEELKTLRQRIADAAAEAERLRAEARDAESFDAAAEAREAAARRQWDADHLAAQVPALEARITETRAREQAAALEQHRLRRVALYRRLREAIVTAAAIQREAVLADQEACGELGEGLVRSRLPTLVYAGLLLPDLVEIWTASMDRAVLAESRPAAPQPVRAAAAPKAAPAGPGSGARRLAIDTVTGRELGESGPKHAPRAPDDPEELKPGHVRCVVVRSGYTGPDGRVSQTGRRIQLPRELAYAALRSGSIEITEDPERAAMAHDRTFKHADSIADARLERSAR